MGNKLFEDAEKYRMMDTLDLDYDLGAPELESSDFQLIPEGIHLMTITDGRVFIKDDGRKSAVYEFTVEDVLPGVDRKIVGATMIDFLAGSAEAGWRMRIFWDAVLGRSVKEGTEKVPIRKAIGQRVLVEVMHEQYTGSKGDLLDSHKVTPRGYLPVARWEELKKGGPVNKPAAPAAAPEADDMFADDRPKTKAKPAPKPKPAPAAAPAASGNQTFDLDSM